MFSPHFLQRIVKSHCGVCGRLNTIASIGEQKTKLQYGFLKTEIANEPSLTGLFGSNHNDVNGLACGVLICQP